MARRLCGRQREADRGPGAREVLSRLWRVHAGAGRGGGGLNGPQDCVSEQREIYRTRRNAMVESFGRAGWDIPEPQASMFAWPPIPEPFREMGSLEFRCA